jgi:hypothetical protein
MSLHNQKNIYILKIKENRRGAIWRWKGSMGRGGKRS